jgi:hypothetical protein
MFVRTLDRWRMASVHDASMPAPQIAGCVIASCGPHDVFSLVLDNRIRMLPSRWIMMMMMTMMVQRRLESHSLQLQLQLWL